MPKANPDFETAVNRYLDGEMSSVGIAKFESRLKKDKVLRQVLREMKFARKAMQVYKHILPSAKDFTAMRKAIMAQI
jgi:hypothetical protein